MSSKTLQVDQVTIGPGGFVRKEYWLAVCRNPVTAPAEHTTEVLVGLPTTNKGTGERPGKLARVSGAKVSEQLLEKARAAANKRNAAVRPPSSFDR